MTWELIIARAAFTSCYDRLLHDPGRASAFPAGLARLPDRQLVLVSGAESRGHEMNAVMAGADSETRMNGRLLELMRRPTVQAPAAFAVFGTGEVAGMFLGRTMTARGIEKIELVRVVAEGLPVANLGGSNALDEPTPAALEMWSRTIGALSPKSWTRLSSLRVSLFGSGRSGSLMANALARAGVREVTLIDPDSLELGNCGEMDLVTPEAIGRAKAKAVAEALAGLPFTRVRDVVAPATSIEALLAAKDAEFLIACVDNPAARLAISFLAQLYLKPLLDIGSGIFSSPRRMGIDVRLVLPGRCLSCFGGLSLPEAVLGMQRAELRERDWHRQRAGSLRSLNMIGVGVALRLLEDFLSGLVSESTWLQINYDEALPVFTSLSPLSSSGCQSCLLAGLGDAGLDEIPQILDLLRNANVNEPDSLL